MDKIKNILIPNREGLENKWWHRFAKVLIYGSTIIFTILVALVLFSSNTFKRFVDTAYSFEPNYSTAKGQEFNCYLTASDFFGPTVVCDYTDKNIDNFLDRYEKAAEMGLVNEGFIPLQLQSNLSPNQNSLNYLIEEGKMENIKVKTIGYVLYGTLAEDVVYTLLIGLGWFIFWESIIYRVLLYIIYGKSK